jgi:DNA-binding transcriptional LysR family regulator
METTILRLFRQVAEGATVTETAAGAHMTQAALSKALKRLDREVGAELLVRVGRQLRLTPAGWEFKQHADVALDQLDRGAQAVAQLADPDSGTIALGFLHTLGRFHPESGVRGARNRHPAGDGERRAGSFDRSPARRGCRRLAGRPSRNLSPADRCSRTPRHRHRLAE